VSLTSPPHKPFVTDGHREGFAERCSFGRRCFTPSGWAAGYRTLVAPRAAARRRDAGRTQTSSHWPLPIAPGHCPQLAAVVQLVKQETSRLPFERYRRTSRSSRAGLEDHHRQRCGRRPFATSTGYPMSPVSARLPARSESRLPGEPPVNLPGSADTLADLLRCLSDCHCSSVGHRALMSGALMSCALVAPARVRGGSKPRRGGAGLSS
jgi:hypothetical protein